MISIKRADSSHHDFQSLVKLLDTDLAQRDGADHFFYAQYNKIDKISHVVVAYEDGKPIGCGAIKKFEANTIEVKRMYVLPEQRGKGVASKILLELEKWAGELEYDRCVLETGKRQPEAIELYKKAGYKIIPNYGQYAGIENSICFEKHIR